MSKYTVLLFFTFFISFSCTSVKKHPWEEGNNNFRKEEKGKWITVAKDFYVAVPKEKISFSETLLKNKRFVELSPTQEHILTRHLKKSPSIIGLKPYLIPGLTLGTPCYSLVQYNKEINKVFVERGVYTGELLLPYNEQLQAWPVVIYLVKPPANTMCSVKRGGDNLLRGLENKDQRLIEREKSLNK